METKLESKDNLRISIDNSIFIDVERFNHEILTTDFYRFHKIEIRKKADNIRVFTFKDEEHFKEFDFGFWNDAEIIYKSEK